MSAWPDRRLLDLLHLEIPIIQAPMAGSDSVALARAVSSTGALGSLACALLPPERIREAVSAIRDGLPRPVNLNFFCHTMEPLDPSAAARWKDFLRPHYERWGLDIDAVPESRLRLPFDADMCAVVEEVSPEVISFHFGLPGGGLVHRLKKRGIRILSTATSVNEAKWLEAHGCDAIIAQGAEAGGHRGMFLDANPATQAGLFSLLPQIADAVAVPVIAAGGIADARGVAAAFALGACGVQLGTAYLFCPEANVSPMYRRALAHAADNETVLTNMFSGRPARGIFNLYLREAGPMSVAAPPFPYAATLVAPLRAASEKAGSTDYMQLWAGQSASLSTPMPAAQFTRKLACDALRQWSVEPSLPVLRTARIELLPATHGDIDALHDLWTTPEVRRYLWDDVLIPRELAATVVESLLQTAKRHGIGFWTLHVPRDAAAVEGFVGFRLIDDGPEIEIMYGLAAGQWGKGLATEACFAALEYLWAHTAYDRVYARTDVPNHKSVEVMRRLKMTHESTTETTVTYRLERL